MLICTSSRFPTKPISRCRWNYHAPGRIRYAQNRLAARERKPGPCSMPLEPQAPCMATRKRRFSRPAWSKRGKRSSNAIHGSEGSIFTDVTRGTPIAAFTTSSAGYVVEKADIDFGWTRPLPEEAFAYGYQAEMRHFVDCVRNGAAPRETYEDGYVVHRVLDAGYQSMRSSKWVRVKY